MSRDLLAALDHAFDNSLSLARPLDEAAWRQQYHPDLSPIGWHVGHLSYIETYWIQDVLLNDRRVTAALAGLYEPWRNDRAGRGERLPPKPELERRAEQLHRDNLAALARLLADGARHDLLKDDYLVHFLIQHYEQHLETMQQVLLQRELHHNGARPASDHDLQPAPPAPPDLEFAASVASIGSAPGPIAYDNELARHQVQLAGFRLARRPVSNAEYLGFMEAGGYRRRTWWTEAGWAWLQQHRVEAPLHWRRDGKSRWYEITPAGPHAPDAGTAVSGINHHEACAYAAYAGARLPHETEWEHAVQSAPDAVEGRGQAWEWCANTFYPYPGFRPFPYDEYSLPWFDGRHYSLRGGSRYTGERIRRTTFRNFYPADKRHIFAGLRLAQ